MLYSLVVILIYKLMKIFGIILLLSLVVIYSGCSSNSVTNPVQTPTYKEILSVDKQDVNIKLFITGYDSLTTGYNDLYFKVKKGSVDQNSGVVLFTPRMWMDPVIWHGAPASAEFTYDNSTGYFRGYAVFLMATYSDLRWSFFMTYRDAGGVSYAADSVKAYVSYYPEKQWKLFFDSTEHSNFYLTLVKPFSVSKGMNDFEAILSKSDDLSHLFEQISEPLLTIAVYKDSVNQPNGNIQPVAGTDGIYSGKINLPEAGTWNVYDTLYWHNHYMTNNPTHVPYYIFAVP